MHERRRRLSSPPARTRATRGRRTPASFGNTANKRGRCHCSRSIDLTRHGPSAWLKAEMASFEAVRLQTRQPGGRPGGKLFSTS
eukprot:6201643-Pleurochrysis_carterae.AAC.2